MFVLIVNVIVPDLRQSCSHAYCKSVNYWKTTVQRVTSSYTPFVFTAIKPYTSLYISFIKLKWKWPVSGSRCFITGRPRKTTIKRTWQRTSSMTCHTVTHCVHTNTHTWMHTHSHTYTDRGTRWLCNDSVPVRPWAQRPWGGASHREKRKRSTAYKHVSCTQLSTMGTTNWWVHLTCSF